MNRRKLLFAFMSLFVMVTLVVIANRNLSLDLHYVAIAGDLSDAERAEVSRLLFEHKGEVRGLADARDVLEAAPWIGHVEVARDWPDGLIVTVFPERAIAYWNDEDFINDEGSVFHSPFIIGGDLAQLHGPKGTEREAMAQYLLLNKALLRAGMSIDSLALDERGGWQFTTERGITVLLGKDDVMERIQRFLLVVDNAGLTSQLSKIATIDTRYPNGLAVSWKAGALDLAAAANSTTATMEHKQREQRL